MNRCIGVLYSKWRNIIVKFSDFVFFKSRNSIIMFHHVSNEQLEEVSSSCKCTIKEFELLLDSLKHRIVPIDTLISTLKNKKFKGNMCVLTFDDVPEDFYYNAFPILKKASLPFTLYITYDYIGKEGYLNITQLEEIKQYSLATIGSHTVTHPILRSKGVSLNTEIVESKHMLENLLNIEIKHFAYPYGSVFAVSKKVIRLTSKAGYRSAVITNGGFINRISGRCMFSLPRKHSVNVLDYQTK